MNKRGFQPQSRRQEQWTVDPFWNVDRPQAPVNPEERPESSTINPSTTHQQPTPMEEGEIDSESDQDPSVLEVPAVNWAKYVGVKSVQYIKMGHAPRTTADEPNNWDFGNAVRESEKNFSTDQLLLPETTNDPTLLKTLVCLERQQQDNIPEEYQLKKTIHQIRPRNLRRPYDRPKTLRTTVISLFHKDYPAIKQDVNLVAINHRGLTK